MTDFEVFFFYYILEFPQRSTICPLTLGEKKRVTLLGKSHCFSWQFLYSVLMKETQWWVSEEEWLLFSALQHQKGGGGLRMTGTGSGFSAFQTVWGTEWEQKGERAGEQAQASTVHSVWSFWPMPERSC